MARIKIKDLPKDMKVSKQEMKTVMGGIIGDTGMTGPFMMPPRNKKLRRWFDNIEK